MNLLLLFIGLSLLVLGGNGLLRAAVGLSQKLALSRMVIGMTVVSLATSAPEFWVSLKAALEGYPALSLGNVVGSNIANLGFVLATVLLIAPLGVERRFFKVDGPILMLSSLLLFLFLYEDGRILRWQGLLMLLLFLSFLVYLLKFQNPAALSDEVPEVANSSSGLSIALFLLMGIAGLWAGSELLIKAAVGLAQVLGLSQRAISVTLVSVGTSIPELTTSVLAALKREKAISLGNLLGSNIFNTLGVMGLTAAVHPITLVPPQLFNRDLIWMLLYAFVLLPLVFLPRRMRLGRWEGALLLAAYTTFLFFTLK